MTNMKIKNLLYYILLAIASYIASALFSCCDHNKSTAINECNKDNHTRWAFIDEIADNDFVLINNVLWATHNVNVYGHFTDFPEEVGDFYQWKPNSMGGYRLPTVTEFYSLLDPVNVLQIWTTINGIQGAKFVDKSNGNMIFLPITYEDEKLYPMQDSIFGIYWSNSLYDNYSGAAYCMFFNRAGIWIQASRCEKKHPIRCVLDKGAFLLEELSMPASKTILMNDTLYMMQP